MRKLRWLLAMLFAVALAPAALAAQGRTVTERVTHAATQAPLAGVQVLARVTTVGTRTDAIGTFSLNLPAGAAPPTFSQRGVTARDVPIAGSAINAALAPSAVAVEGVVVTALGLERWERTLVMAAQ